MDSTVTVQEVMNREFVGVSESDTVADSAELLLEEGSESVVVLRGSDPVGVLTQRDALAALVEEAGETSVAEAMQTDVPTVSPVATIAEAAGVMSSQGTGRVLVTTEDRTLGLLSEHDLFTTSPFEPDRAAAPGTGTGEEAAAVGGVVEERETATNSGYEDQSICEACGSFARDLSTFNGQLLCADCRDI